MEQQDSDSMLKSDIKLKLQKILKLKLSSLKKLILFHKQ